jgi:hypothetical protein
MALNPSGRISIGGNIVGESINLELNLPADNNSSLNDPDFRALAGIPTGTISLADFYGKSRVTQIGIFISTKEYTLSPAVVPGYIAGSTNVELVVNPGVYVYSDDITKPGLLVTGFVSGDSVKIVNNGFIIGKGGQGGITDANSEVAESGGNGISTFYPITIENNSYIAGGGGGGADGFTQTGAGGGAGGGKGGNGAFTNTQDGGYGGAPGMPGQDGRGSPNFDNYGAGGGGGRILPGLGGAGGTISSVNGKGGGAGGGGAWAGEEPFVQDGGAGGSANSPGQSITGGILLYSAAGGGGWGASGGNATHTPGAGGKGIALNGRTATITGPGIVYGAIS